MTALREEPGWYGEGGGADGMYASRTVEADREGRTAHYDAAMANGFRFALQSAPRDHRQCWPPRGGPGTGLRHFADAGGLQLPSPMPALAIAAEATTSLQVGTYVLASPLRAPRLAAADAHTLSLLSPGSPFTFLGLPPRGAPTPGPPFRARRPSRRPGSPGPGR